jgi:hypothetical protein
MNDVSPMTNGISCPVVLIVYTPEILLSLIVSSMNAMKHPIVVSVKAWKKMQSSFTAVLLFPDLVRQAIVYR